MSIAETGGVYGGDTWAAPYPAPNHGHRYNMRESALPAAGAAPLAEPARYRRAGTEWSVFGTVMPVLAGSSGAGASVFAAAASDVLQQAGRCALLVDTSPPVRSGLILAAREQGHTVTEPLPGMRVRYSWRARALLAHADSAPEPGVPAPGGTPELAPPQWLPMPALEPLHVTIADLGQEWSRPTPDPTVGAAAWLRTGTEGPAQPWPVLVVRPTRPSLMAAETALSRLDALVRAGEAVAPVQLVVMASFKRRGWPRGVVGTAGARVSRLLDDAVFVPYHRGLELAGVTDEPTPRAVQEPIAELLHRWGLLADSPTTD